MALMEEIAGSANLNQAWKRVKANKGAGGVDGMTFRHAACRTALVGLDEWIRRKLRCVRLKQCKRPKAIAALCIGNGVPAGRVRLLAGMGKGWWRRSGTPPAHEAMWTWRGSGASGSSASPPVTPRYKLLETARYAEVRPVV